MTTHHINQPEVHLLALRELIERQFQRGGNLHWKIGETLNAIRERIISVQPESERQYLEMTIPEIDVVRAAKNDTGQYTLSSHEGFRLFHQLLPLLSKPDSADFDVLVRQEQAPEANASATDASRTVFIGHGRSKLWARVQVFLENELGLRTVSYESESRVGESIVPILEELLDSAGFAVLLLTSEDETAHGTKRARQNVVHEIGLFQGRFGFRRVVLLKQEGIEEFSNVAGLQYIPFAGDNLEGTFYELRRVLQREGLAVR